jgi:hypothetical protein
LIAASLAVSPTLVFVVELALKMALTATIVVAASVMVERSGPFIGAIIASLPTAAGATYIILALEHPPSFVAASAIGSLAAGVPVLIFALVYAALAQRHGLLLSLVAALVAWLAGAAALHAVSWTPARALALNAVAFPVALVIARRYQAAPAPTGRVRRGRFDIPLRALTVALFVVVVTSASHTIGSFASGTFAVFPIAMASFMVILQPRVGGPAAASVLAHSPAPLIGLGLGFLAVHYLAEPIGPWWSYAVGLAIILGWNGLLWFVRRQRAPRG